MDVIGAGAGATSLELPGSRALIVGTGSHPPDSRLPDLPAVGRTVAALGEALVKRCGLGPDHVRMLTDPADPKAFLGALTETAAQAEDVLLLYYIGHGLVSLGGELYLATRDTSDQDISLAVEALSYATVREALTGCRARAIMVVLDCCFSGRAYGAFGTAVADAFELTYVRGSFLLSAASATEAALAPEGDTYTAFSGAVLGLLRDGDPAAPRYLTFEDAYRHLARVLPARGLPGPHRRAGDRAGDLVLAVNQAAQPVIRPHTGKLEAVKARGGAARTAPDRRPCPYPGLSPFTADDARYFFGRARLVDAALGVVARLAGTGPVALVGGSGSGKSSLLQAGLLPAIRAGRLSLPGSRDWPRLVMTPGEQPLRTLATRLAHPAGITAESARTRLAADPARLASLADAALHHAARPGDGNGHEAGTTSAGGLVLCVDQFEELFTRCSDEAERHAFIRALCAADGIGGATVVVILGIRADFYGDCVASPELGPTLRNGQIPVQPMTAAELRAAIQGPADAAGLVLEDGLADRVLQDLYAGEDSGRDAERALPLLAYALQATWRRSDAKVLTLADYQATGGIWKAVTQAADRTFESLDPAARLAARDLLLCMVWLGENTEDVRRRVSISELLSDRPAAERAAIAAARDALVAARLITVADEDAEITHEALLRAWPRLRTWISEDRSGLLARQRLADAARTWDAEGRNDSALYSGARLEMARQWLTGREWSGRGSLSPLDRKFLLASIRTARAQSRRSRAARAVGAVVALALVATGVYAFQQRASERDIQAVQTSVQLAAEADTLRASDPAAALWLSLAAYSTAPTAQARSSVYDSYTTPYPVSLSGRGSGAMVSAAYSPDGLTAAGAWGHGTVRLWRVTDPLHPILIADLKVSKTGIEVAFSRDSRLLAVHTDSTLQIWDVHDPARPVLLSSTPVVSSVPAPNGQIVPVAFSPDGRTVVTGNADGRVRLWDVSDPRHPVLDATLAAGRGAVQSAAFSPDGRSLAAAFAASGGVSGRVRLWDVTDPRAPASRAALTVGSAEAVAFSPVGHLLVAVGGLHDVNAWNTGDDRHPAAVRTAPLSNSLKASNDETDTMTAIAFRPDSESFVTADSDGRTEVWTAAPSTGDLSASSALPDPAGAVSAAFSPSGQELVTGDRGGAAELWTVLAPLLPGRVTTSSGVIFGSLVISTDGAQWTFGHDGTLLAANARSNALGTAPVGHATLWDITNPLRPALAATFRGWTSAAFLPDGRTLVTFDNSTGKLRLWDTADPRHMVAGATLTTADGTIAASDGGHLLAVSTSNGATDHVQVWNVRDFRRPVLDSTIKGAAIPAMYFLDDRLLGIASFDSGMQLWDLADPRHPVKDHYLSGVAGVHLNPQSLIGPAYSYTQSGHVLTTESTASLRVGATGLSLWNLADPRNPRDWEKNFSANHYAVAWIDGQTLAGGTAANNAIDLWDVRYRQAPTLAFSVPIGNQSVVNSILTAPGGSLLAAGISTNTGDIAELWQVLADHRGLAEFAQFPGDSTNIVFSPGSQLLATNVSSSALGQLAAFTTNGATVVYPLNTDSVYRRLCALTAGTAASRIGQQYLADVSYRLPC